MKKLFLLLTYSSILFTGLVSANNLPPLASFTDDVNRDFFFAGESVTFDGSASIDQDEGGAYINYYRWRVDGVIVHQGSSASQYTTSFSLSVGQSSKTVQVSLEVRDDENTWTTSEGRMTKTYTIRRGQDRHFYLKDHLGSVRVTVDEEGEPLGFDDYYPYGLQMPTRSSNTANPNDRYKFTGHEKDTEAGLNVIYAGARYLDPVLGMWYSIDPLSDQYPGISPYNYALNNPVFFLDPTGKFPTCIDTCDDIYEVGSTVENRFGSFEYLGENRWLDLNNNFEFGSEIAKQFAEMMQSGESEFNLIPNQNGPFHYSKLGYTLAEGSGLHGSYSSGGGYNVTGLSNNVSLSYTGYIKTSANAGQSINNESSLNVLQGGKVVNTSGFSPSPTISVYYGKVSNHYNLGAASVNLPKIGSFKIQLVTGFSYKNAGIGLVSKSMTNYINLNYYQVKL